MSHQWLSVTVELLGRPGRELWPAPARVFLVGPTHTLQDLAEAIDVAFARWDLAHQRLFTLPDGATYADDAIATLPVAEVAPPGTELRYTFDLGERWLHSVVVDAETVDPSEELETLPAAPVAYRGWGVIPDQYGRRYEDDDGTASPPLRPTQSHPMLDPAWPAQPEPQVDADEVRGAVHSRDVDRFLAAVVGHKLDGALQQVGAGLPMALEQRRAAAEPVAREVIARLRERGDLGDDILGDDLQAILDGAPLAGRGVVVDLDEVSDVLGSGSQESGRSFLDLTTGEAIPGWMTDEYMAGDGAVDVEEEPGRWIYLYNFSARILWEDMADFAAGETDPELRDRIEGALEGRGAFRRFRGVVYDDGVLRERWRRFSAERSYGRVRDLLADEGIRAV
ncbi:MAG: hypothetical protein GX596_00310 [Propionibacterium sp.]|nr:hypothetical protein [Propionibacterium sp.]